MNSGKIIPPHGFRESCAHDVRWYDASVEGGHSNFHFVDEHYESQHTVRRIFSLARKLGFNSFCVENISSDTSLLQEENANLQHRNCGFLRSEVTRISFFRTTISNAEQGLISPWEYIGYGVIKKDICSPAENSRLYVYESVLPTHRNESANNFLHCYRQYQVQYSFGLFDVIGSLYAQQNDLTFVCAHVALRSVLSLILDEGDISYAELNQLAGISVARGDVGLGKGMQDTQLEEILRRKSVAYRKIIHDPVNLCEQKDYSRYLYGFIEANCPSLLLFPTQEAAHVVPVVGHTFNEDMWVPDADDYFYEKQHYSSERWLSTFLIHDDNYGQHLCLPKNYLDGKSIALYGLSKEKAPLCFDGVEIAALERLSWFAKAIPFQKSKDWYNKFVAFANNKMLVLRPIFIGKCTYLLNLQKLPIRIAESDMPPSKRTV